MLRSNFGYDGNNADAKEFVETVNRIAVLLNGLSFDFGAANGGTDVTTFEQTGKGLKVDLTRLYMAPPPTP